MRWDTPLQMFERWVLEDVELRGVAVPKGAELGLLFGSANRDPEVFDRPDELDLGRDPTRTSSSAPAIHFCLGAPLARLELADVLRHGPARLPALRLVRGAGLEADYIIRGLRELRVAA